MENRLLPASDYAIGNPPDLSTWNCDGGYTSSAYRTRFTESSITWGDFIVAPDQLHLWFWTSSQVCYCFKFEIVDFPVDANAPVMHTSESGAVVLFGHEDSFTFCRFNGAVDSPTCTVHKLYTPVPVNLSQHVLVDDHLGIVYICSEDTISAVYYA